VVGAAKVKDPSRYGIVAFNNDGSIGDHVTLLNTETENSIVMTGTRIDYEKKITDSIKGKDVEILDSTQRLPEGHRLARACVYEIWSLLSKSQSGRLALGGVSPFFLCSSGFFRRARDGCTGQDGDHW
jgi:hypothetical protein